MAKRQSKPSTSTGQCGQLTLSDCEKKSAKRRRLNQSRCTESAGEDDYMGDDDFGTRQPPLTDFIMNLLQRYTDGGQILKELIQNADDARASKVKFLIDSRQHPRGPGGMWKPSLAPFQGPALLAWNNSVFSEVDWRNIGKLHQSQKEEELLKVGRFGLGFQSVHHLTDLPIIASGSHVGLIDPHETILDYRDSKGARVTGKRFTMEEFRKYQGQVATLDGVLGFNSSSSQYDGTLFRFPFRNGEFHSEISDRTYTREEALEVLYDSLAQEAHRVLLFLNHITDVELYDGNPCALGQPLLRIAVNSHEVQGSRAWYKSACTAFSENQGHADTYLNKCTVTVEGQLAERAGTASTSSWLMCSTIGVRDPKVVELASRLEVIPWVGLAAPLSPAIAIGDIRLQDQACLQPNCATVEDQVSRAVSTYRRSIGWTDPPSTLSSSGFAFCFLPMSATNSTGLPVHIHGYFTLSDNRRRVRWPDADDNSDEAKWNKHLVKHLIAPSYAILMTARCMMTSYQGFPLDYTTLQKNADPFALLPVKSEVSEKVWKHLIRKVQPLLSQLPILWTAANNGMWVKPPNAYFVPPDASVATSVVDLLLQLNYPIVCLPINVQESCTTLGCKLITPDVVGDYLRRNANPAMRLLRGNGHLLKEVIRYVFSNGTHNLQGLPLVPLQQAGSVGTFSSQAFYVLPKNDMLASQVLHGLENQIVSISLPSDLQAHFIRLATFRQYSLQLATADVICPNLLRAAINSWSRYPNATSITWSPSQYNQPPSSWLSSVWRYIADNGKLQSVAGLPLIATTGPDAVPDKDSVTLYPLNSSGSTVLRKTSASSKQMQGLAETLGCTLVNDSHLYAPFGWQLNQYLPILSSATLFNALQLIPNVARTVASLDNAQKRCLRKYLAEAVSLMGSLHRQQVTFLQSLPVYEVGIGTHSVTFVRLGYNSQVIFPHHSISFPSNLAFPSQIVKVTQADQQLCQTVFQRPPLSFGALVQQHIFKHATTQCNTAMRNQILMWIIQMSQPQQNGEVEQFIRRTACIPASDNTLCRVDTLNDPEDSKLQEFFHSCEAKFPTDDFTPVLHKLKQFGIRTWRNVTHRADTFGTFLQDRSQSVQFLLSRRMEKEARQRSKLILQTVANHAQCQYLLQCVQRQRFLFCQQSPPSGYPEQLHWAGSGAAELLSLSEVCASSDSFYMASLVGSVCPIIDNTYTDSVRRLEQVEGTACFLTVSANQVLQHFTNITNLSANALKSQPGSGLFGRMLGHATGGQMSVDGMVEHIYEFVSINHPDCFQQWTLPCIWDGEQGLFVEKWKVALRPLDGCSLAPYRYSVQDLPCVKRYESMWRASGVDDYLTVEDGVQVVSEIQELSDQLNARDLEIVVNVANYLKENKEKDYVKDMYLPSKGCRLHRPEDLTYHDHYLDMPEAEQGVNFIHPQITSDVARFFGVLSLSVRAAPSQPLDIEYECTGPNESITHRIKGLVEDYGDNIDVFKELIQNADDAGATEVKFLIDWRTHKTGKLLTKGMAKWQGPALYAYNNKTFSDEDLQNISKLAGATKEQDHTKIGRFGVGFCATYHLTDVPSFITRRWLQVFDPHLEYLGERVQPNQPGMKIDFVKQREGLKKYFSDQVAPYQGVFGCNVFATDQNGFNGTLFRFPFRQQGIVSDISPEVFTEGSKTIESLKRSLFQNADTLLLFLQNVNKVELFECGRGCSIDKMQKVFQVTRSNPDGGPLQRQFRIPREHFSSVRPCSQKMKIVTSMVNDKQQPQEALWEVSSAMGRGTSLEHANSQDGQSQGLVPVAEVAVRIKKQGQAITVESTKGTVSCFLPLPIETSLNFVVNAFFDVSKDRRLLKGVQGSSNDNWNVMLMKDALVEAVFTLLVALTEKAPVENHTAMEGFLAAYYNLFPLKHSAASKPDTVGYFLAEEFEKRFPGRPLALIWSACNNGCWLKPSEVVVLGVHFTKPPFTTKQYDMVCALLVQQHMPIAQVPPRLRKHLRRMKFKEFCKSHFLGMIFQIPTDIRDQLMLFILENLHGLSISYDWLKGLLSETRCIPCKPHYDLCQPGNLVMQNNPLLANLFDESEERFAADEYEIFSSVLGTLGAAVHKLTNSDVSNRAEAVQQLLESEGIERASKRSSDLVNYLVSCHFHYAMMSSLGGHCKASHEDETLVKKLSTIQFLPVMGRPADTSICWVGEAGTFACSKDLFLPKWKNLVFATSQLWDNTLFQQSNFGDPLDRVLPFSPSPNVQNVLLQLKHIIEWWQKGEQSVLAKEKELISHVTQSIYATLSSKVSASSVYTGYVQQRKPQTLTVIKQQLNGIPFIWKDGFHLASHVFLKEVLECPPYLVHLQSASSACLSLFPHLGVKQCASDDQLVDMLRQMANDFGETPVEERMIDFAVMIATRLSRCWEAPDADPDNDDMGEAIDSDDMVEAPDSDYMVEAPDSDEMVEAPDNRINSEELREQLYLPDHDCVMRPCSRLMYMDSRDLKWLQTLDTFRTFSECDETKRYYLHPTISWEVAASLSIESPLEALLANYSDDSFMGGLDYGQCEDLCDRLNGILCGYHADTSIFKEFVQNADDAGASEIAFVLDQRKFETERLLFNGTNWKRLQEMPSLLIFNDRKFSDEDIKGIIKLGRGGKQDTPETIGRFGIGFNVAYHVTDCPMFVSHKEGGQPEHFCVFDPNRKYAPLPANSPPGRRWELTKDQGQLDTVVVDQMEPFSEETLRKLREADPGSFAQMNSPQKWEDGYVLFRLPLTRESLNYLSRLKAGNKTTAIDLRKNLIEFSQEAADTLLFLNSVRRISIFEISAEGKCSVIGSCHAEISPEDQQNRSDFAQRAKEEKRKLKENQTCALQTAQSVYQVGISGIQTNLFRFETPAVQLSTRPLSSTTLTQEIPTTISSSWIISKRFGGGDMDPILLKTGFDHSFLPFGGVAAQGPKPQERDNVSVHRPQECKVFCYLPLPKSSGLPVHVNGHFWLNDSRRELQFSDSGHVLKDWNKSVCNDVICKAYAELLLYCRDVRTESGAFVKGWYYKLFPKSNLADFLKNCLLPEHLYCLLLDRGANVLLALQNQPQASAQWLSLTNEDGPTKGWFYNERCDLEQGTLLKLDVKLTAAPLNLASNIEAALSELRKDPQVMYTGRVTPAILRGHLRTLCPNLMAYKAAIVEAIAPLLAYCLWDVTTEQPVQWKKFFEDVPLMLTKDDELRKMCEVFEDEYAALLPQCNNVFVHESISSSSATYLELQRLHIIKPLEQCPQFVAEYLTIFPRNGIVSLAEGDEFKEALALFWMFFNAVHSDNRDLFNHFSVVPTTDGRLFPFSECKNIMFTESSLALIKMFCLPVVDFGCIFKDQTDLYMCGGFSSYFAGAEDPDDIIHLLSVYKTEILQRNLTPEDVDVQELVLFLEKSIEVRENRTDVRWMQSLPLFKLVSGELSTINSFAKAYDVRNIPQEGLDQINLITNTAFVIIPAYCTQFMQRVGVLMAANPREVLELYAQELVPNFKHLPMVDTPKLLTPHVNKLYDLSLNLGINDWTGQWHVIFSNLSETPFIETASGPKCVKELYDPRKAVLKACLPEDTFPPPPWDSDRWLRFFANMNLCHVVSEQLWLQFARGVAQNVQTEGHDDKKYKEKAKLLLEDLASKRAVMQYQTATEDLKQFLRDAAVIKFVPCEIKSEPCRTLQQALPEFHMPHQGWTTLHGSVLQAKDSDYQLACLYRPVLPSCFRPSIANPANALKLLGVESLTLYPTIVARNLVELTRMLEGCRELSFEHGPDTVTKLHELFHAHYQYLNLASSSSEKIVPILQAAKCILVRSEDGSTFDLFPGSRVVAKGLSDTLGPEEKFSPLLQQVPEEFQTLTFFLRMAGVADGLEVSHCLFVLRHLFKEGIQNNPNKLACATAAYNTLVKLLRKAELNLEGPVLECLQADVIPLLSKDQQLLPACQLILDDAHWYGERVTPQSLSRFKLVMPPPKDEYGNHSLPACLGVNLLSSIIAEHPHPQMLHDRNVCTKERRAAVVGKEHGCEFVTATTEMIASGDFFRGIVRVVKHENKRPPSDETVKSIEEKLQSVTVKCVQVIKTVLQHKENDNQVPNSENESILCLVLEGDVRGATVYIAPHSDIYNPYQLLHQLACGLNRYIGGIIRDNGLLVQMLDCGSHCLIERVLSNARIPMYVHGSEQQPSPSKIGQAVQCIEQLDNVIVCTFRVEEIVKFCNAEGRLINAQVVDISSERQNGLQTCRLRVNLSNLGDQPSVVDIAMSPLVMSKYLYPQQREHIASEWQVEVARSTGGADVNLQPHSVLPLTVNDSTALETQLTRLYTVMVGTFSQSQVLHVSRRLVHHLHYLCTKNHCVGNFKASTDVLLSVLSNVVRDPSILQRVKEEIEVFLPPVRIPSVVNYSPPQQIVQRHRYGGGGGGYAHMANSVWYGGGGGRHRRHGGGNYGGGAASVWQVPAEPPPEPNLVDAKMWLIQALNDYEAAKVLLEDSNQKLEEQDEESRLLLVQVFPAQVCFLAHESMEKCLKSLFLALFGLRRRLAEHTNVADLCKELQENQLWFRNPPVDLMPQVLVVSSHFLRCRYPEHNIPKMAPAEAYRHNFEEAIEAVSAVESFLRAVRTLPREEVTQMFDAIDHSIPLEAEMQMDPNSLPPTWIPHVGDNMFMELPVLEEDYDYGVVADLFNATMGTRNVRIFSIDRIQNVVLWRKYNSACKLMRERLGYCNEKLVFHGTRRNDPQGIFRGTRGLDVIRSDQGAYGKGVYLAKDASLSHGYRHVDAQGYCQMLAVQAALGDITYRRSNTAAPPMKPQEEGGLAVSYDSIQGQLSNSTIYVVLNNDQMYPAYVITYRDDVVSHR